MSEAYNDGSIPHGSTTITIQETGATYDIDGDFAEPQSNIQDVERPTPQGGVGGAFGLYKSKTGSLTTQLATTATEDIEGGQTFKTGVTGNRVFIVTGQVVKNHPAEGYKTQSFSFREKINV